MKKPKVTIIIPIYNEAKTIRESYSRLTNYMRKSKLSYELILFDDASTDNLRSALPKTLPKNIRIIKNKKRAGRGESLKKAIESSGSNIILYLDADLSFELDVIPKLINAIKSGAAIATDSRLLPNSRAKRTPERSVTSKTYNTIVRTILGSKLHDHQCGCKAFNRKKILPLLSKIKSKHWFWDTEILVLAQKNGLETKEIPIAWWEGKYSSVNMVKDSPRMFAQILSLRKRLR